MIISEEKCLVCRKPMPPTMGSYSTLEDFGYTSDGEHILKENPTCWPCFMRTGGE